MTDIRAAERIVCDPADCQHATAGGQLVGEDSTLRDLTPRRSAVRALRSRVRGDDVPEQNVLLRAELGEDAVDDRGRRLRRAVAGEEPLRGERDPGHTRAAIARRLADEQDVRASA